MGGLDGLRILLVEDDVDVSETAAFLLTDEGADVRTLQGGAQVLATVRAWVPDRIILDLMMVRPDGYDVMERLRDAGIIPALPLLVFSAKLADTDTLDAELQHLGARGRIRKPWGDWPDVVRVIANPPAALYAESVPQPPPAPPKPAAPAVTVKRTEVTITGAEGSEATVAEVIGEAAAQLGAASEALATATDKMGEAADVVAKQADAADPKKEP